MSNHQNQTRRSPLVVGVCLALLPLILAGLYVLIVNVQSAFRYDKAYFSPEYQERYSSPGSVAIALEQAIRTGDAQLYAELTGLRGTPKGTVQNPNSTLTILLDIDDQDYFHYLYFDMTTMLRDTRYIKEVNGRWVVSPQDAFFYFDSGQWMRVFTPISATWWTLLLAVGILSFFSNLAARSRTAMGY